MLMDLAVVFAVVLAALATWISERAVSHDRAAVAAALAEDPPGPAPVFSPSAPDSTDRDRLAA